MDFHHYLENILPLVQYGFAVYVLVVQMLFVQPYHFFLLLKYDQKLENL
jgi:hypothetical protein